MINANNYPMLARRTSANTEKGIGKQQKDKSKKMHCRKKFSDVPSY